MSNERNSETKSVISVLISQIENTWQCVKCLKPAGVSTEVSVNGHGMIDKTTIVAPDQKN